MSTAVIKIKVKDGQEADFEAMVRELVAVVNANEPGVRFYQAFRTKEPGYYCFLESFVDEAASKAHVSSEHFKEFRQKLFDFFDGPPEMQRLSDI